MAHKHENPCPIPDEICAAYREQQRIIKLLETEQHAANEQTVIRNVLNGVIALIKGEHE